MERTSTVIFGNCLRGGHYSFLDLIPSDRGGQTATSEGREATFFFSFWPCGMRDISSLTRDQICAPCSESAES